MGQGGLEGTPGRLFARSVTIETEVDVLGKPKQPVEVICGRRGAERCDGKVDAVARECYHVHVAFDDHETIDLSKGLARLVQAVQFTTLVE